MGERRKRLGEIYRAVGERKLPLRESKWRAVMERRVMERWPGLWQLSNFIIFLNFSRGLRYRNLNFLDSFHFLMRCVYDVIIYLDSIY